MKILVTGGAGFIGSHLIDQLLGQNHDVVTIDNFDSFYDRSIKERNIRDHLKSNKYQLLEFDFSDNDALKANLAGYSFDVIIHLAAKAGVRPSISDPLAYQRVNVQGTHNLLEYAKDTGCKQFVFASSSSVYGINPNVPWSEKDQGLLPISPYASTKVSGELLGHVYSHLYDIRFVGLRFFTVYGPRQRPDLAIHKFAKLISQGTPIPVFGDGTTRRDYTFIEDIVFGIQQAMNYDKSKFEIINLGNCNTVSLSEMIHTIADVVGKEAIIKRLPMQPGDVSQTFADISKAQDLLSYAPTISFKEGIEKFWQWMKEKESTTLVN